MATLLQLIATFPILEAILPVLSFADLLNLSRVDTNYRAILHGFNYSSHVSSCNSPGILARVSGTNVRNEDTRKPRNLQQTRSHLHVGNHQTDTWRYYKSAVRWLCSEPHHTVGQAPKQCLRCSMPVCEACIVKSSMKKNEHTFDRRRRFVCENCWARGVPHLEGRRLGPHELTLVDYDRSKTCRCTSSDGTLCLGCIEQQNSDLDRKLNYCAGRDCSRKVTEYSAGGRVCLWCTGVLPSLRSQDERKKGYEARYLSLSTVSKSQRIAEERRSVWDATPRPLGFEDQRWVSKKASSPSRSLSLPSSSLSAPSSSSILSTETKNDDLADLGGSSNDQMLNLIDTPDQMPQGLPHPPAYLQDSENLDEGRNTPLEYSDDEETLVAQDDGDQLETMTLDVGENQ